MEQLSLTLLVAALAPVEPARLAARAPKATRRARLCHDARAAMIADPALCSIIDLARLVGCSPHHLSRVFRELTGLSFSEYRRNLRLVQALERILDGERSLAQVAADCGFADHAHLTRTLRRRHQLTPHPATCTSSPVVRSPPSRPTPPSWTRRWGHRLERARSDGPRTHRPDRPAPHPP